MSASSEILPFPSNTDHIPVPRTRYDLIRLLAHNTRSLDTLACQVAAADLDSDDKLNLLRVFQRLAADTAAELIKLEHRGDFAAELVPRIRELVDRLQSSHASRASLP